MNQYIKGQHSKDENGNPAGGTTTGTGILIAWQNGPLSVDGERKEPNGAFVEGVIEAAIDRLEHYQTTQFKCESNAIAIARLCSSLDALNARTADREARGVEGTHEL